MRKLLLSFLFPFPFLFLSCSVAPGTRFTLQEANDYLSPITNSDRNFTQGIKLNATIPDDTGSHAYGIGQNIWTPGNKQVTAPQSEDRPYAGLTYADAQYRYRKSSTLQDSIGATLGIIGPHSYAEQSQNEVHRLLNIPTAKGWDNQINDELGLMLTLQRENAFPFNSKLDLVTIGGVNIGNIFTQGYLGANFRVGPNLPDFFTNSVDTIYPRRTSRDSSKEWVYYAFGGPSVRAVLWNFSLDGNLLRDSDSTSASIDKEPLVAEGRLGFSVEYENYRGAYTYIVQTHEFKGQADGQLAPASFGQINLSYIW